MSASRTGAKVVSFCDVQARRAVAELQSLHDRIYRMARAGGEKRRSETKLAALMDELDRRLELLERTGPFVRRVALRRSIDRTARAHRRWLTARMGTAKERAAVVAYLESFEAMVQAARA